MSLYAEADGYFSGFVPQAASGIRYRYCLDDSDSSFPDPASRGQPDGVDGPSHVVDPSAFHGTTATGQALRSQAK